MTFLWDEMKALNKSEHVVVENQLNISIRSRDSFFCEHETLIKIFCMGEHALNLQ